MGDILVYTSCIPRVYLYFDHLRYCIGLGGVVYKEVQCLSQGPRHRMHPLLTVGPSLFYKNDVCYLGQALPLWTVSSSSGLVNPCQSLSIPLLLGCFVRKKGGSGMTITGTNLAPMWLEPVIPLSWVGSLCLLAHYLNSVPRQKWPPGGSQVVDIPILGCAY